MDFGIYPPEINSGRMYAGPGSGPMLAAAQAWAALADELYTAAGSYQSVASELTSGPWSGPSSASMTAAAATYVEWLSATAAQAEETAAQARPRPPATRRRLRRRCRRRMIAANRSLLTTLVATNFFGQNTPAIAATEAQYAEMWAQDAVAMYVYAGSSASATALTAVHLTGAEHRSGATASQAAAVSQAAGTSAGNAQSAISVCAASFLRGTQCSAEPRGVRLVCDRAAADPLSTLSDLIAIFLGAPDRPGYFSPNHP